MTEVRLYGRMIDRPRLEVGVAMDNLTEEVCFRFDVRENPYIADGSCAVFLKTDTLQVPCKLPMTVTRTEGEAQASIVFTSGMIPFAGCFTGQLQIEVAHPHGGFFVWQSLPFDLIVARTIDADKTLDSQLSGAYDRLFAFEQAEAQRAAAEAERNQHESERISTMNRLQQSLSNTIELIERMEGTLEADRFSERVDQDVRTTASPSFVCVTAQLVQAEKVIGAVYA